MCRVRRGAEGTAAASCGGSRPAKGLFGSFLVPQKGTRTPSVRKLCTCCRFMSLLELWLWQPSTNPPRREDQRQSFHALRARLTFVLSKVSTTTRMRWRTAKPTRRASAEGASQTAFAGRDPPRYSRGGPLRFSDDGAHWDLHGSAAQNSLRSDMGCSSAPPSCDARLALRLDTSRAESKRQRQDKGKSRSDIWCPRHQLSDTDVSPLPLPAPPRHPAPAGSGAQCHAAGRRGSRRSSAETAG